MNIAIVIENFDPAAGGNERSTLQVASELARRGHGVTILASGAKPPWPKGLHVETAGGPSTHTAAGLLWLRLWANRRLNSGRFDVSLSMTTAVVADVLQPRSGTVRQTLERNAAIARSPLGRTVKQWSVLINLKRLVLLAVESRTFKSPRVKKFVAISSYVADQLVHHYAIASRRIALVPNAVADEPPDAAKRQTIRDQTRQALQLRPDDRVYLFLATNPRLKGLAELLEAFRQVRAACPAVRLVVAGTMDLAYRRRAERMGLAGDLRWVGPTGQVTPLYLAADVTVLPTWYDPCSRVVLESLRLGTPAISTRYNGASLWIADPTGQADWPSPLSDDGGLMPATAAAGRVIDSPDRIDQLAGAMADLADDDNRALCRQAAAALDDRLTIARHVDALERLLKEAAGSR